MTYLRSIFLNFLVVFFVNRMVPGIEIGLYDQVPNIGADLLFSGILGCLNASVFPFLFILELDVTRLRLAIFTFLITFSGFITIAVVPFGVRVVHIGGLILGGLIVWAMAFFTNYLEWHQDRALKK